MSIFRNMEQPESDIKRHPAYATLPEDTRKAVDQTYNSVFQNNQRMGIKIAQGMAYEAARQMCESYVAEGKKKDPITGMPTYDLENTALMKKILDKGKFKPKKATPPQKPVKEEEVAEAEIDEVHLGWNKMVKKLKSQGHGEESADKIAGYINAKKNHLGKFAEEEVVECECGKKGCTGCIGEEEKEDKKDSGDIQKKNRADKDEHKDKMCSCGCGCKVGECSKAADANPEDGGSAGIQKKNKTEKDAVEDKMMHEPGAPSVKEDADLISAAARYMTQRKEDFGTSRVIIEEKR